MSQLKEAIDFIEEGLFTNVWYMHENEFRDILAFGRSEENNANESIDDVIARIKLEAEVEVQAGITFYKVGKCRIAHKDQ